MGEGRGEVALGFLASGVKLRPIAGLPQPKA